jgi:hypothetical protein
MTKREGDMNARKFFNVRVSLTVTALALSGALVISASCAGGGGSGGSAGSGNGGSAGSAGSGNGGTSGGNGGSTGTPGACTPSADGVCFSTGKASGVLSGYGWIALGSLDTASSPVCDNSKGTGTASDPITNANACTTTTVWSSSDALCISGNIPALPATPAQTDYDNNWGLQIGVNSSDPAGTPIGSSASYTTVTFNLTGTPLTGLRAELHRQGDPAGTTYCASLVNGKAITLTSFSTQCYGGTNDIKLTTADIPNIDKVGVQVSSTGTAITVSSLCLTSVQFGK